MQIVDRLEDIGPGPESSLALGTFDGVHRGHQAVIEAAVSGAKGLEPGVFTFTAGPKGAPALVTPQDKRALLERAGVERMIRVDFESLRDMEAASFVEQVLVGRCRARRLCCGEDFRFGRGARGDVALLKQLCKENGVALTVMPPVLDGGEKISSTAIRAAVEEGDIPRANRLLGRPFGFSLEVIHGNHIGTGLGTPTINQAMPEGFVQPRFGVYAAWCRVAGVFYCGVANIGVKPTVGSDRVLAETWMPGFSGDLYGQRVRVFLLEFLRPEKKFGSLEELKEEIFRNARQAEKVTRRYPHPAASGVG